MLANPIILVIMGIALLAYVIYRNWDKIAPFMKKVWDKVTQYVSNALTKLKNWFNNLAIVQWFKAKWNAAIEYMIGLGSRFMQLGSDIVSG